MPHDPARPRLVLVDDEPEVLDVFRELFDGGPWTVVACASAAEARRALASPTDLLLTDKNLPDGSGLSLMADARGAWPDCEVILITGYASLDTAIEALQHGAFDYIVKPPESIFDVRRKVEQALAKQAVERENRRLVGELQERAAALEAANADLVRTRDELVQAEKLAGIGTLAAGIAHEIGSPLFGIMGLAEAISDEPTLDGARAHAREIVTYAATIKEIVGGLGRYTRLADPEHVSVGLAGVVADAVRLIARARGVDASRVAADVPDRLVVHGNPTELQQVFVNLVKNGLEAADPGEGRVTIAAWADGDGVRVDVCDNGTGIPEAARRDVFDPFYTTKPPGAGTGLGLNIVYRIVARHQGTIRVGEAPGGGACVCLRLPGIAPGANT